MLTGPHAAAAQLLPPPVQVRVVAACAGSLRQHCHAPSGSSSALTSTVSLNRNPDA